MSDLFEIKNIEPESALGFPRYVFIAAGCLPILEGIIFLFVVNWSYISIPKWLIITGVYVVIRYLLFGWFFDLLQKGSMVAVIIQTILCPIAVMIIIEHLDKANSINNQLLGIVWHTYVFQTLNLLLVPLILYANWSTISKIRKGIIRIVPKEAKKADN